MLTNFVIVMGFAIGVGIVFLAVIPFLIGAGELVWDATLGKTRLGQLEYIRDYAEPIRKWIVARRVEDSDDQPAK